MLGKIIPTMQSLPFYELTLWRLLVDVKKKKKNLKGWLLLVPHQSKSNQVTNSSEYVFPPTKNSILLLAPMTHKRCFAVTGPHKILVIGRVFIVLDRIPGI